MQAKGSRERMQVFPLTCAHDCRWDLQGPEFFSLSPPSFPSLPQLFLFSSLSWICDYPLMEIRKYAISSPEFLSVCKHGPKFLLNRIVFYFKETSLLLAVLHAVPAHIYSHELFLVCCHSNE